MKGRTVATLAAAAALAVPVGVSAMATADRTGTFDAGGIGTIIVKGRFSAVFGTFSGRGVLVVRDRAGDAVVKMGAVRQRRKRVLIAGRRVWVYTIRHASGSFFMQGRALQVVLSSPASTVSMTLFGSGLVTRLAGAGVYHLNGGPDADWQGAHLPVVVRPPHPTGPRPFALAGPGGAG